jgi:hypothetical protein
MISMVYLILDWFCGLEILYVRCWYGDNSLTFSCEAIVYCNSDILFKVYSID